MTRGSLCPACSEGTVIDGECHKCGAVMRRDRDLMTQQRIDELVAAARAAIEQAKTTMPTRQWKAPE